MMSKFYLTLRWDPIRVDPTIMLIKGYTISPLETAYLGYSSIGSKPFAEMQTANSTQPSDMVVIKIDRKTKLQHSSLTIRYSLVLYRGSSLIGF